MTMQPHNPPTTQAPAHGREAGGAYKQIYVRLSDAPYAYGELLDCERVVDYAADGTPIGVEFLRVSECAGVAGLPRAELVASALEAHDIRVCA